MMKYAARIRAVGALAAALLSACIGQDPYREHAVPGGDPQRGRVAMEKYGCAYCHRIPGFEGDPAIEGPPLTAWSQRQYIAGSLPNRAEELIRWIVDPHAIEPGTAMPTLGVTEEEARDMAAYLYSLGEASPPAPADTFPVARVR
jgi:cytochrome c